MIETIETNVRLIDAPVKYFRHTKSGSPTVSVEKIPDGSTLSIPRYPRKVADGEEGRNDNDECLILQGVQYMCM